MVDVCLVSGRELGLAKAAGDIRRRTWSGKGVWPVSAGIKMGIGSKCAFVYRSSAGSGVRKNVSKTVISCKSWAYIIKDLC